MLGSKLLPKQAGQFTCCLDIFVSAVLCLEMFFSQDVYRPIHLCHPSTERAVLGMGFSVFPTTLPYTFDNTCCHVRLLCLSIALCGRLNLRHWMCLASTVLLSHVSLPHPSSSVECKFDERLDVSLFCSLLCFQLHQSQNAGCYASNICKIMNMRSTGREPHRLEKTFK